MSASLFSNVSVPLDTIPKAQDLRFTPLPKTYLKVRLLVTLLTVLELLIPLLIVYWQPFFQLPDEFYWLIPRLMPWLAGAGLLLATYLYFADRKKAYVVRQQDLSYSSGLIFHKLVSQPILRVQHVELKRGPFDRLAGLAKLQVFSAGSSMQTFEIPGLEHDTAQKLRQFVLDHRDLNSNG